MTIPEIMQNKTVQGMTIPDIMQNLPYIPVPPNFSSLELFIHACSTTSSPILCPTFTNHVTSPSRMKKILPPTSFVGLVVF